MNIEKCTSSIIEGFAKVKDGMDILSSGPLNWYMNEAVDMMRSLFDRFCPWKTGDRVELTTTPEIHPESGWHYSRHFLIAGARGTVESVYFHNGLFRANVIFDDESWLKDGVPQPIWSGKHTYSFSEKQLRRIDAHCL